jgi:hypothetical protein
MNKGTWNMKEIHQLQAAFQYLPLTSRKLTFLNNITTREPFLFEKTAKGKSSYVFAQTWNMVRWLGSDVTRCTPPWSNIRKARSRFFSNKKLSLKYRAWKVFIVQTKHSSWDQWSDKQQKQPHKHCPAQYNMT